LETAAPSSIGQCAEDDRAQPPALAAALGGGGRHARVFGALALWAFEFGKQFAGLEPGAKEELGTCAST
jgi:hypothetical protein